MGMDVYGKNPVSETGEYFRNNVWWWRPLWEYCVDVAPELTSDVSGHYNDGDGLDADGAQELARILLEELESGNTAKFEEAYRMEMASLPRHDCKYCGATGIRTDDIGVEMGMPDKELEEHVAIAVGRTHGWCNGCGGEGKVDDHRASYPFSAENVRAFAEFLEQSGGFSIY